MFSFLTDNPIVFYVLFAVLMFVLWQIEIFAHPGDHQRTVERRELRRQDKEWKKAK